MTGLIGKSRPGFQAVADVAPSRGLEPRQGADGAGDRSVASWPVWSGLLLLLFAGAVLWSGIWWAAVEIAQLAR